MRYDVHRFAVKAADGAGEQRVTEAVLGAAGPYRSSDGGYRLENTFVYLVAHA